MFQPRTIIGVDFSGAKLAGENIWLATADVCEERLKLRELRRLADLAGTADRAPALAWLAEAIMQSIDTLWAMDFPFALPIELACIGRGLDAQLATVAAYAHDARHFGRWLLSEAKLLGRENHIRRVTDREAKTPFDCYHYRIVYQTFHGMRDVLGAIAGDPQTCVLPFQTSRLKKARRVVVEACPSTTLKRLSLPHQRYKQPAGGALTLIRRRTRQAIFRGIDGQIEVPPALRRVMARNPGGDAIDAVLAAVGGARAWASADHRLIAAHDRYPHEGYIYG